MYNYVLGVYGFVDHGKSTLLNKLTEHPVDTTSTEKKLGITIRNTQGSLYYNMNTNQYVPETISGITGSYTSVFQILDNPGHESYTEYAAATMTVIDVPLLILDITSTDLTHFLHLLKVFHRLEHKNIVVVLTKLDLSTLELAETRYKEVENYLKESFEKYWILPFSAKLDIHKQAFCKLFSELSLLKPLTKNYIGDVIRAYNPNAPGTEISELKGTVLGIRRYNHKTEGIVTNAKYNLPLKLKDSELGVFTTETDIYHGLGVGNELGNGILHDTTEYVSKIDFTTKLKNIKKEEVMIVMGSYIGLAKLDNDKQEITFEKKIPKCLLENKLLILKKTTAGYKISYIINERLL